MKVLLVSINQATVPYPVYPLGIAHLTGALRATGHEVALFDLLSQGGLPGLATCLDEASPELIGLSLRNVDTVDSADPSTFLEGIQEAMALVRRLSTAPVVLGGTAFSLFPEAMMALLGADYGVVGEGEESLSWLINLLQRGEAPAERIIRRPGDDNPWGPVAFDSGIAGYYLRHGGMLSIQAKRGCPFLCDYCSYPLLEGRRFRYRAPEEAAEEAIRLARKYGAKYLFFADAIFNDPAEKYLEVAEALLKAGNRTPWCAYFKPKGLTREGLSLMKRAGLAAMEFGTDAASDATLAGMHKGFAFDDVLVSQALADAEGLPVAHFVIFGGPGETRATLREGVTNMERLAKAVVFGFSGVRILPGAPIHDRALAEGVIEKGNSLLEAVYYFAPETPKALVDLTLTDAWKGRMNRLFPPGANQRLIDRMHEKGRVGPLWDLLAG